MKNIPDKYPFYMVLGSAHKPQRFWSYVLVKNLHTALILHKKGYVLSNKSVK